MPISEAEFQMMQARLKNPSGITAKPSLSAAPLKVKESTDEEKLNKTERAYLAFLRSRRVRWIGIQNITLKLADDTRYTPDFWTIDDCNMLNAIEVKGFFRDDAKVKLKVAARQFPFVTFWVVRRDGTGWTNEHVKS